MRFSLRTKSLRIGLRLRRLAPAFDASVIAALGLGIVALLETSGTLFATEYWDLLLLLAATIASALGLWWLRVRRPSWLDGFAAWARETAGHATAAARISIGVDFRPEGPIRLAPFRTALLTNSALALIVVCLLASGRRYGHLLGLARESLPYTLYLTATGLFWLVLMALDVCALLFLYLLARLWLARHTGWPRERRVVLALVIVAAAGLAVFLVDASLGVWGLLAIFTTSLVAPLAVRLAGAPPGYAFTVRREATGRIYSLPTNTLFMVFTQGVILVGMAIFVFAQGYRFLPEGVDFDVSTIPLTHLLGRVFGWLGALISIHVAGDTLHAFFVRRPREDPSLPRSTRVWLAPDLDQPDHETARGLRRAGIDTVRGSAAPRAGSIDLVLYADQRPETRDITAPAYPIGPEAWTSPALPARLRRLDARSCRRRFFQALRRLHELATSRRYRRGEGFFLAPHCWLIEGLTRDQSEDELNDAIDWEDDLLEIIGPSYHRLFGTRLRRYVYQVFRSCRIDLVFWQDGVSVEALLNILERLFRHHEIEGASRPIEERDLFGVLGVSAHVQEIGFEEPLVRLEGYREPDYEDISRARILLVLREGGDNGGEDDEAPDPLGDSEDRERWLRDTLRKALPPTLTSIVH